MNHPEDILNQGLLDNLPDYTIFKKKTPKMRRYASTSKKYINDWHFTFIKNLNSKINYKYWISLNGYIDNHYIQSSPIINAVNNIIYTENSMYYLGKSNLSLPHPLFDRLELVKFTNGFPKDWKDIICKQIYKIFGDVRIENSDVDHLCFFEKTYNKIFNENIKNNHNKDGNNFNADGIILDDKFLGKTTLNEPNKLNISINKDEEKIFKNIDNNTEKLNDIFFDNDISNARINNINIKESLCNTKVEKINENKILNDVMLNNTINIADEKLFKNVKSIRKDVNDIDLFLEENINEFFDNKKENEKINHKLSVYDIDKQKNKDDCDLKKDLNDKNKEEQNNTDLPENLMLNNNSFDDLIQKFNKKKFKKLLQNQNNNNFEDDLFKNIDFDCIKIENHNNKQDFKTDLNCYTDQNIAENKNNMFNNETYKKDKRDNSSVYELGSKFKNLKKYNNTNMANNNFKVSKKYENNKKKSNVTNFNSSVLDINKDGSKKENFLSKRILSENAHDNIENKSSDMELSSLKQFHNYEKKENCTFLNNENKDNDIIDDKSKLENNFFLSDVNLNISDKKSLNSKSEKYEKSSGVKYSSIKSNIKLELDSSKNLNTDKKHEIYQTIKNVNKNNTLEFFDSTVKNSNDSQYTINNNEMMSIATKMKNNDIFSDDSVNVNKEMLINVMEDKNNEKQTKKRKTRTSLRMPKNFKLSKKKNSDYTL